MKVSPLLVAFLCASLSFVSCKKMNETSLESEQRAASFKSFIINNRFQVKAYYSDKPVDYIEDDAEIREETDLFRYVSPWLKDDWNVFDMNLGQVTITQNGIKISNNPAKEFVRNVAIGSDNNGVYFDFLDYQYNPLRYRLLDFKDNYFIVYVEWKPGIRVFTRFEALQIKD